MMPLEHLQFLVPGWRDVVEILIVAFVLYQLLLFLAGTRALQILVGLIVLGPVYVAALLLKLRHALARSGAGAIIVVERDVALNDYLESGTEMHAAVSADLLATIFTPYSPLHDGAVLIRGDQIIGAGCVLPLTQFPVTDRSVGTRHRAALALVEAPNGAA